MNYKTLWIDHQHAYVFEYNGKKVQEKYYEKKDEIEKTDTPRKFTHAKEHLKNFYHAIALTLGDPEQLLILGPGIAKDEFKHHCELHHHSTLAKAIVGVETMRSNPRKSEILKASKIFYDQYFGIPAKNPDFFNHPV